MVQQVVVHQQLAAWQWHTHPVRLLGCCVVQAIRSDNPIIFFEHVLLYNIKGETHDGDYCQSLEKCEVSSSSSDRISIVHSAGLV
jgi:pyruvate/2-oxoglutarate/acetoin dehydrogenase E1 component